jgi:hypothetical protein
MTMTARAMPAVRAVIQPLVPDAPASIEARAMTLDDDAWAIELADGAWVLGSDGARLLAVVGGPAGPAAAREAVAALAARPGWTLLAADDRDDVVATARAVGRAAERATIYTLPDLDALPAGDGATLLGADEDLAHLPPGLAEELGDALGRGRPVWCARVDGVAASFAYAPWRSESWFDVAVDTAAGYRQLGLATIVAAAMIRLEYADGRRAVWGADDANLASVRLARRLGFEPTAALWVIA